MPRDIEGPELRHLLQVPETHLRNGVLCIALADASAVRITGYEGWLRVEHLTPDEYESCIKAWE